MSNCYHSDYIKCKAKLKKAEQDIVELKNKCFMLEKGKYGVEYYANKIMQLKINDSNQKKDIKLLADNLSCAGEVIKRTNNELGEAYKITAKQYTGDK